MVSTRGGTRTSAPDEAETMLRKKPVRRATAKAPKAPAKAPAKTTTTTTASKARTARPKETKPEPALEQDEDDEMDELQQDAPAPVKTTRKAATRAKKGDDGPASTSSAAARAPVKAAKAATATSRATKGNVAEDKAEKKPEPAKPELKTTTQSRATRATRATAAKEKATPLSPKKITQISKAPAKKAKAAAAKTATATAKSAATKPATRGRPAGRRRNVSDENADVPDLSPPEQKADEIEANPGKKAFSKARTTSKRASSPSIIKDVTAMSTRQTTPARSVQQDLNDTHGEEMDTQQEAADSEDEDDTDYSSQDELTGPKSLMKRLSPREAKKYASAQSSTLPDVDEPMKTPVRRFAVFGTQQGTPQTQKPFYKPALPMPGLGPMTVMRAQSRPMVFQRLLPLAQQLQHKMNINASVDDTLPSDQGTPDSKHQGDDVKTNESEHGATPVEHEERDPDLSLLVEPEHRASYRDEDEVMEDYLEPGVEEISEAHQDDEVGGNLVEAHDETIITADEGDAETAAHANDSLGRVESVIVTRQVADSDLENIDGSTDACQLGAATPKPEILIWENIRDDVTIPFNFHGILGPARSSLQAEAGLVAESVEVATDALMSDAQGQVALPALVGPQRNSTVRLSEFVDMASWPDSRQEVKSLAEAGGERHFAGPATVEDGEDEDETMVGGDVTLHCAEPATPQTVKRSPIRLTTVQHIEEDESFVDGDVTLSLEQRGLPERTNHSPVKLATLEHVDEDEDFAVEGEMSMLLEQRDTAPSVELSPVKLSTVEDHPEADDAVGGDLTLVLDEQSPAPPEGPATPVHVDNARASDGTSLDLQERTEEDTPHYALSTFASRRKSLSTQRPDLVLEEGRPQSSNSAVISFGGAWFDNVQSPARPSISLSRPVNASGSGSASGVATPVLRHSITARLSMPRSNALLKDRMPALPSAKTYEELLESPSSFGTEKLIPAVARPAIEKRCPGLPSRQTYEDIDVAPGASPTIFHGPISPAQKIPATRARTPRQQAANFATALTPQPAERPPGVAAKRSYEEHAETAMPASFVTPRRPSTRRPATTQKPHSLRKLVLAPKGSHTPIKTPLKAPVETPAQVPMTPHPKAPLTAVVALVDVYTSDGSCATAHFSQLLQRLGAKTTKTFSDRVTHVIFKDGHPKLLQSLVVHNKQVSETGSGKEIFCINSRWVIDCDAKGVRMSETDEAYMVDIDDAPLAAKRRRKSMEPMSLLNHGGNIVRDRKSSLGRVSIGRLSSKTLDPRSNDLRMSPPLDGADQEHSETSEAGSSPATPAYLSAPEKLVQQTAPTNRVRKLDLKAQDQARRLTFANMEF